MIEPSLTARGRSRLLRGSGLAGPLIALVFAVAVPLPTSAPALPVIDAGSSVNDRTISFFNLHTKEKLTVTYKRNGHYDQAALDKINHMLRDWRRDETIRMDPRLIDLIYEIHEDLGSREAIGIVSGYRSPATNAVLRKRSRGVAKHSQHTLGKAMDVWFPDVPLAKLRETALLHEEGGVGYYPTSGRPFVHIDVGPVRYWPRMPRSQLARLFPDGDTKYIPADGRPLGRKVKTQDIQVARAEGVILTPPTPPERPGPADRDVPPDRPVIIPRAATASRSIEVAHADPSAPVRSPGDGADAGPTNNFLSSLFGFKAIEEPKAAGERPQDAVVAGLEPPSGLLPEASSTPLPTPRPDLELAAATAEAPLNTASLVEPEPAAGGEDEHLTTAFLPSPEPAESGENKPLTIASLLAREVEPANGNADEPLTTASLPKPAPQPAESGEKEPVTTASLSKPQTAPAEISNSKPVNLASLWEQAPEAADSAHQPLTVASRWQLEPKPAPVETSKTEPKSAPAETSKTEPKPAPVETSKTEPKPAPAEISKTEPMSVASLWKLEPASHRKPLNIASRRQLEPKPAPAKAAERPVGPPMMLASLAPAPSAPAAERTAFKRDAPGIWTDEISYAPPTVASLVAYWRVHGEAFAAFTGPDQIHLGSLMRAPEQSLIIRFTRGPVQTPYAAAFVGTAVAPLKIADVGAPLVTAAR